MFISIVSGLAVGLAELIRQNKINLNLLIVKFEKKVRDFWRGLRGYWPQIIYLLFILLIYLIFGFEILLANYQL